MEREFHPYLERGEAIVGNRMIVGTFPVYSLTLPRTAEKDQVKLRNADVDIFYGSNRNHLRAWYKEYVDPEVNILDPNSIWNSWQSKGIAVSDVIKSAIRQNGANDDGLESKEWNNALAGIVHKRIDKIICTSKAQNGSLGWLIQHILIPHGFVLNPVASNQLQNKILEQIEGAHHNFSNSIAKVFTKGTKRVEIVALPSPGSPFRQLHQFGFDKKAHDNQAYLDEYLRRVFNWFLD